MHHLGFIPYKQAWDFQELLFERATKQKVGNRELPDDEKIPVENHFIFCEHPHVVTLGKTGDESNLLLSETLLQLRGIEFYRINRGGDVTYHGPEQIVGYPIIDLDQFFTDIHKYLRTLEEVIIRTLAEYGIRGERYDGFTGVWLDIAHPAKARKICAMGVRTSRWITMHGFALNVNNDLSFFDFIIPCGIKEKQVTSLEKELGRKVDKKEVKAHIQKHFSELFEASFVAPSEAEKIAVK